jgi:hypothetical protein
MSMLLKISHGPRCHQNINQGFAGEFESKVNNHDATIFLKMKKSSYTIIIFSLMLISSWIYPNIVQYSLAQGQPEVNPCPIGQFPETDSNGLVVRDPVTGGPRCSTGPSP